MKNNKGFTILEMMIVLSIIALIFLLTLPNIQQKEKIIRSKGCEALIEVANAQIVLYEVENLRLVRKDGYEIFLQDVDSLQFQKRKECMYVIWTRNKHRQEALLACE